MVFITSLFIGILIHYWPKYGFFLAFFIAMAMEIVNNILLANTVSNSENRLHDMYQKRLERSREREEKYIQVIDEYKQMLDEPLDDIPGPDDPNRKTDGLA